ncbi:dihydrolipoamide acetyltransferase family protein [Sinomonas humi]|uniref:Dihydrolipoamide acetyltransferase component of pyruvate dehydrogenase complex n=1 Tax=Sinomonas humi TaxID=1338436 RepID=A0A0B2AHA3_9MICC|nr:dihydrolipoamide acetyltransferase family protein [Sinomonas humi]KHL01138.1 branched-chain alpha-keto acid dehydrogenase subunit E2 [Sinomonas humi]
MTATADAQTQTREFRLPDLGEGLTESEIVAWRVGVGDSVELNQVIGEVETAKAVVELPSPFAGRVTALLAEPGQVVAVGAPIAEFEVTGTAAPRREPNLVGYGAMPEAAGRPARKARSWATAVPSAGSAAGPAAAAATVPATGPAASAATSPAAEPRPERPRSTPPVRKLAKDLGVDLAVVHGTGPKGLVTRDDVLAEVGTVEPSTPGAPPATSSGASERETRIPVQGVRKQTAAAMVASAFTAPHASEFLTVDVTPTMELLARLKASKAFSDVRLTPMTLAAKAVLVALRRHPSLNAKWDEKAQEIVQYHYVNLGFAAATPRGLLVPNVKDAEMLDLRELADAIAGLVDAARDGRIGPSDLTGGTITITNIGVFGVDAGTPILNPGEAAILALGQVRRMPWEYRGEIALREVLTLSLSFDHRIVDGEQGSRFLADVGAILGDPGMVMTMV